MVVRQIDKHEVRELKALRVGAYYSMTLTAMCFNICAVAFPTTQGPLSFIFIYSVFSLLSPLAVMCVLCVCVCVNFDLFGRVCVV